VPRPGLIAAVALTGALVALPAAARPYLMLNADDQGFQALDLGGIDRSQAGLPQVTLIDAPLKGVAVGDRLAPLVERRVQVDCAGSRWRVLQSAYVDGQERVMGRDQTAQSWTAVATEDTAAAVQAAACRREYRQQAVSRYLNLGEILANYQAAHAKPAPEPLTRKELEDRAFKNGH